MKLRRVIKYVVLGLVILVVAAVIYFAVAIAPLGTRYVAKRMCSGVFVAGLPADDVWRDELAGGDFGYPGRFRWSIDETAKTVTGTWFGIAKTTARLRPGLGCTPEPLGDAAVVLPDRLSVEQLATPRTPFAWPPSTSANPSVTAAIAPAFEAGTKTRAVVVIYRGQLVAEQYAVGVSRDTPLLGWSMNKSIIHALIGTQVLAGNLSLDAEHLFDEWKDERAKITLRQLLNMSSSLAWDESYTSPYSDALQMLFARDAAALVALAKPLEATPGARWKYSSGTTNLLALLLRRTLEAKGIDYLGYPQRALYAPLGMTTAVLEPDPSGTFVASSFGYASPLDWARFGQLYLQDGVVDGVRLLPEGWRAQACTAAPASGGQYGGQFWLKLAEKYTDKNDEATLPADTCHAVGHEGQLVTIIPSRELVVVRMGVNLNSTWNQAGLVRRVLASVEP